MTSAADIREIFETMSYGPAPESPATAQAWLDAHAPHLGLFIDNDWRDPSGGEYFPSVNPANAQPLIEVAQAAERGCGRRRARRSRRLPAWSATPGHVRARYLYALARQIQKHSRLLAVLETMDNGKPIRETRDIDIPLVARHFYHHAGWAQLMASRDARDARRRRRRADHPLELPAADAGVEDRARARGWQHRRPQARRVHLDHRHRLRRDRGAHRPAARRRQHHHRRRTHRRRARAPSRRGQDRLHRLDRGRAHHPPRDRWQRQAPLAGAWRQVARSWSSTTPISTGWSRAWWTRSGSTRARSAAPARGCSSRRRSRRCCSTSCARAWRSCASATRWTRRWTSARSSRRCNSRRSSGSCSRAWTRARGCGSRAGPARPTATSIRRRSSPTSRPPRPSRRSRSSGPCSSR